MLYTYYTLHNDITASHGAGLRDAAAHGAGANNTNPLQAHGSATVTRLNPELRLYPGGPFSLWCLHAQLGTRLPAFVLNHCYGDVCIDSGDHAAEDIPPAWLPARSFSGVPVSRTAWTAELGLETECGR